jgi:hypothetical protein
MTMPKVAWFFQYLREFIRVEMTDEEMENSNSITPKKIDL